jgi:hypothetical protein
MRGLNSEYEAGLRAALRPLGVDLGEPVHVVKTENYFYAGYGWGCRFLVEVASGQLAAWVYPGWDYHAQAVYGLHRLGGRWRVNSVLAR